MIIGGGAAGLSGAVALGRALRSVLVIDGGEPRNAPAEGVHNYLTRDGMPPAELVAAGREEAARYGVEFRSGQVSEVTGTADAFRVTVTSAADTHRKAVTSAADTHRKAVTSAADPSRGVDGAAGTSREAVDGASREAVDDTSREAMDRASREAMDGEIVEARRIIVASGVRDVLPDIPGLAEGWGSTVVHCPYCHGWEVRGSAIGVIATSAEMATMKGLLWSQWTGDLLLFLNDTFTPDPGQARQLAVRGVQTVAGKVEAVTAEGVHLTGGAVIPRDHLVVATRVEARLDFLAPLGLKPVEHPMGVGTHLPVEDPSGRTSVPGVWAAGNITEPNAQVISSAAAGLGAGAAVNMDLILADAG
ncbi:hypothetical protein Acsp02_49260 [Actinoplanes sp. NBRC 103695]|nr:hypothetical protein Acsp02_49260 [Actinoplanes sp. NBRC 103695]